jgi:hypothetical protein
LYLNPSALPPFLSITLRIIFAWSAGAIGEIPSVIVQIA